MRVGPRNDYTASKHKGRLNARVMETVHWVTHFMGVWNAQVTETACKLPGTEAAGNGNGM